MSIPISTGSGAASVAAEAVGGLQYQQIELYGAGGSSIASIGPDGALKVSVTGTIATTFSGNPSISGTVNIGDIKQSVFGASVIGWVPTQLSNTSVITVAQGSVAVAIVSGSILTSSTANQSVSGTVDIGNIAQSVFGASIIGYPNVNVGGSVVAFEGGTWRASVINSTPSSLLTGASIFGQLPAGTAPLGSVATLQGTNPWVVTQVGSVIATLQSSSIIAINAGSVVTVPSGSTIAVIQAASIAGTYAEDAAHTTGDRGLFALGVRNDLMSSVTSADGDYSPLTVGPVGEKIVANAPISKWVQGTADFRNGNAGASIIAIAAGGSSVFTYVTGVQVANMGSASVLVTLASGGSTLGYTIAPAGGGSNINYQNALKTPANFGFAASISGIASVLVSAQGFTAKT